MIKKQLFFIIFISLFLTTCEDVIQVDLKKGAPKLIIDAGIVWDTTTTGATQSVVITNSKGYYEFGTPTVSGAIVSVKNTDTDAKFDFIEENPNSGRYICNNFIPVLNNNYELTVVLNGVTYKASEKLIPTPEITRKTVKQTKQQFDDLPITEVNVYFKDNLSEENYYLFAIKPTYNFIYEYRVLDDKISNGNEMKGLYFNDEMNYNDNVNIQFLGISKTYYEYLNILLDVAQSSGNPFDTPASQSTLGNIINTADNRNNPYGFFRLSQVRYDVTDASNIITN